MSGWRRGGRFRRHSLTPGWLGLYEIVPGFFFAWLATAVASRMGQPPASMLQNRQAVEAELQTALATGGWRTEPAVPTA